MKIGSTQITSIKIGSTDITKVVKNGVTYWTSWDLLMLESYLTINNHVTFTPAQQALILGRLQEDYVVTTFGPTGLNKTVCDFFIFLQVHSSYLSHSARTNTKSGGVMRWNYGDGNIYTQNNVPAQISTSVVTITSTDGFTGWTGLDLSNNGFLGNIPHFPTLCPNLTTILWTGSTSLGWYLYGDLSGWQFKSTATSINLSNQSYLSGDLVNMYIPDSSFTFNISTNSFTGTSPYIRSSHSQVSGLAYNVSSNMFSYSGGTNYIKSMQSYNISNNFLSTTELTGLITRMNTWFISNNPTINCVYTFTGTYNGTITGGESNTDLINLNTLYTNAGKTFTKTYNPTTYILTPFDQPYVCFNSDDGYETDYTKTNPLFVSKGIPFTNFKDELALGSGTGVYKILSQAEITSLLADGVEFQTHLTGAGLTDAQYRANAEALNVLFTTWGIPAPSQVAYVAGASDALGRATLAEYYVLGRTVNNLGGFGNLVYKDSNDITNIPAISISKTTSIESLKVYVDYAILKNAAIIFYFHMTYTDLEDPDDYPAYAAPVSLIEEVIDYVQSKSITCIKMSQLYAKIIE